MMIGDLLSTNAVFELREPDKRRLLKEVSHRAAAMLDLDEQTILEALNKRESLGSTGIGQGVAIPHARLAELKQPFGLFALMRPPIQFDAVDDLPVDLVFLLLLPETLADAQLKPLACVARRLRDPAVAAKLRGARGASSLYAILIGP